MLSVDPSIPADSGDVVRLRPSMKKFDAEIESLGVVRHSTFAPAYLNHQIITLLASVHIEDEVFVALQERMKRALDAMFESKEAALRVMNQCASEVEQGGRLRN